jgi:glycosyltransferase involved in cell wall biosynthesis
MTPGGIVMIVSGFPRCSETFLLNELLALDDAGMLLAIFATKPGDAGPVQALVGRLAHRVVHLPPASAVEQVAFAEARLRGRSVAGVHGYFAHEPASIALGLARRLDVPFGFSVHAKDLRKISSDMLDDRVRHAVGVVACNADAADTIRQSGHAVHLAPHGVDLERFCPRAPAWHPPLRLLGVGRLVEKKGFSVLVEAVARLAIPFELRIIGEGPDRARLQSRITSLGLDRRVMLCGPLSHDALPPQYAWSDIVVVPSIVDRSGDRDGLPNVVLEAMASARAVVASDTGAMRTVVKSEETGLLVRAADDRMLARALERLARDRALRERLARAARLNVELDFALARCTRRLCNVLTSFYA